MRKLLLAGVLALPALLLTQGTASAWCFDFICPKWEICLPRIPIIVPSIKIRCEECNTTCAKCSVGLGGHKCKHGGMGKGGVYGGVGMGGDFGPGYAPPPDPWYTYWPQHHHHAPAHPYAAPAVPTYAPQPISAPARANVAGWGQTTQPVSYQPGYAYPAHYYSQYPYYQYNPTGMAPPAYWYGR